MNKTIYHVTMFSQKRIFIITAIIALIFYFSGSPSLTAQTTHPGAQIVWMDNPDEVTIRDKSGTKIQADFGLMLESESVVQTAKSSAEIVLVPNGSVIIIDKNTTFRIDSLQTGINNQKGNENAFSLILGKFRMVAAKIIGATYSVSTPTAVAGVRGTDFYRMYDPAAGKDWLCVTEGAVQLYSPTDNEGVLVPAGFFVNLNNGFQTAQPDKEWLLSNLTLNNIQKAVLPQKR